MTQKMCCIECILICDWSVWKWASNLIHQVYCHVPAGFSGLIQAHWIVTFITMSSWNISLLCMFSMCQWPAFQDTHEEQSWD